MAFYCGACRDCSNLHYKSHQNVIVSVPQENKIHISISSGSRLPPLDWIYVTTGRKITAIERSGHTGFDKPVLQKKMKIWCLVTLLVCALAQGANVDYEDLPLVEDAENHLEDLHLELDLLSADHAMTEDDKLLISELQTLEAQGRSVVADAIAEMIEDFRDVVINGNDDIPPLDPLDIPLIGPFEYKAPATTATVSINDFKMEGLRWYVLDRIAFNAFRLSFEAHITIPWITVTGSYDARARLGLLTHRAGGGFRIFAHRIEVGMDMRMGTNILAGHLILRELNINIDIHDTHIQFHGMTGSNIINAFINSFVQNLTQELIQAEMENVSKMLSEELFDVVNDVLKDYTINDILGF